MIKTIKSFARLARKIYQGSWKYVIWTMIVCTVVFFGRALFIPTMTQNIFDVLELGNIETLMKYCGFFLFILLFVLAAATVLVVFPDGWFNLIAHRGSAKLFEFLFKMPYEEISKEYDDGELFNRLVDGSNETISVFAAGTQFLDTLVCTIIFFVIFGFISKSFILIALCFVLAIIVRTYVEFKTNMYLGRKKQEFTAKREKSLKFLIDNLEQLEMNHVTEFAQSNWEESRKSVWKTILDTAGIKSLLDVFVDIVFAGGQYAMYTTLSGMGQRSELSTGVLSSSTMYFSYFRDNLDVCRDCASWLPSYLVPIERMTEMMDKDYSTKNNWKMEKLPDNDIAVRIENLGISFNENPILKNLSLSIRKGEKVAIIGDNGCGKSTLIKAILGEFVVTDGSIKINTNKEDGFFSYVPVNPQMYSMTAYENIKLGAFREGYELPELSFGEVDGTKISGGQQQQTSIYRAMVTGSEVLIADEATSALNVELRDTYLDKILSASSVIFITHDKNILPRFDKIVMIKDGCVAAEGTYQEISNLPLFQDWKGKI